MRLAIIALCAGLLPLGCQPTVEFDVDTEGEAVVREGTALEQVLGGFPVFESFTSFDISDTQEFENHGTTKDHVREAYITDITLSVVAPAGATFDFLDEITFFVEAPDLPKEQVATKSVPNGATTVDLELRDLDIAPYVKAPTFSVTTTATGRRPSEDTTVRAEMTVRVVANP